MGVIRRLVNRKNSITALEIFIFFMLIFLCFVPVRASEKTEPKKVRVGFYQYDGYHMIDDNGEKSGYGYEYLQHMLVYNNWIYEYEGYDKNWSEILNMLENGEIDILTSGVKTRERMEKFNFSAEPIGSNSLIFSVKAGNEKYLMGDYENFNGIKVGLLSGNSRNYKFAEFAGQKRFNYVPVYYNTVNELLNALKESEEVDAIVTDNLRAVKDEWILAEFDSVPFYAMVRKGDNELLNEVNYAIEQIHTYNTELEMELSNKYYSPVSASEIPFSMEERKYIKEMQEQGVVYKALLSVDRYPLSGRINGMPKGIMIDILDEIIKRSGLGIEIVMPKTREEYYSAVRSGDYCIVLDSYYDYNKAEKNGYKLSEPYIAVNLSQVRKKGAFKPVDTVAAVKYGDVTEYLIENRFSQGNIHYYNTFKECAQAVMLGKQDAVYMYTYAAQNFISANPNYKLVETMVPEYQAQFSIGVDYKEKPLLLSVLNKAISSMDEDYIESVILSGTYQSLNEFSFIRYLYDNPLLSIIMVIVVSIIIIYVVLIILKQKRIKSEKELLKEFQRFVSYVCKVNDKVIEIDLENRKTLLYEVIDREIIISEKPLEDVMMIETEFLPEDYEKIEEHFSEPALRKLIDTTGEAYFECKTKKEDGTYNWYAYTLQGLAKDTKHPKNFMLYKHDIDEVKRDQESKQKVLRDAMDTAQQANETKSSFMSRMSHEMRTPLNGIMGYITIALEEKSDLRSVKENIEKAKDAARHLLAIINDVLDMASIESGKIKIAKENFAVHSEMNALKQMFQNQAEMKKINFHTIYQDITAEHIRGDKLRVNQILYNLLSNAIKFTPDGGTVNFTISQLASTNGKIFFRFIVSDTGIGMSKEFMTNMFVPFEQQDASISQKYGGTGLGLSITKNLIVLMEGVIRVESEKGKGSTFTVELPFETAGFIDVENSQPDMDSEAGKSESSIEFLKNKYDFKGICMLLAEDNAMNTEIAVTLLSQFGFELFCVENGQEAVEEFAHSPENKYSAILMDIQMPVLNGYDAAKKIRLLSHPQSGTIPIFAMTADAFSSDVAKALSAGMNGHISKPLEMNKLLKLLEAQIKNKSNEKKSRR